MDIGSRIKEIRAERGLSQDQMAEQFNVSRQTVSNWENDRHYPDLATLIKISGDFSIPLDDIVKGDEKYVEETDRTRRKLNKMQKVLLGFGILLLVLIIGVIGLLAFIHFAYKGTPDSKRIMTDTDIRMVVNLPGVGNSPSRAITDTYRAAEFDGFSKAKRRDIMMNTSGRVEGDIPIVYTEKRGQSRIDFVFQDNVYVNIEPEIRKLRLYKESFSGESDTGEIGRGSDLSYDYHKGVVTIYASDFTDLGSGAGDDIDCCLFEIRYRYKGKEYVSFTAVNAAYDDYIELAGGDFEGFENSGAAGYIQYVCELPGSKIRYRVTYDKQFKTLSGSGGFSASSEDNEDAEAAEDFASSLMDEIGSIDIRTLDKRLRNYYDSRGGSVTVKEKKGLEF